jgi:hypothetical protein
MPSCWSAATPSIQTDFLRDLAVLDPQHCRPCEVHLPARRRRQRTVEKIAERGAGMGAAAFPPTDHVVALGDEVCGTPEFQVGKGRSETLYEVPNVFPTAARRM